METPDETSDRVASRAALLPEEAVAGSEDAKGQSAAILADSDERTENRDGAPGSFVEHRTSDEATEPSP